MLRFARSPTPPPDPADFAKARDRHRSAIAKHQRLLERIEGMSIALAAGLGERKPPAHLAERAAEFMGMRRPKLAEEFAAAHDELAAFKPWFQEESAAWQAALRHETDRVARDLQPQHRAAVKAITAAVESLSVAVAAEREVRAELERRAPLPQSAYLPDMSTGFSTLDEVGSASWVFAQRLRQLHIG